MVRGNRVSARTDFPGMAHGSLHPEFIRGSKRVRSQWPLFCHSHSSGAGYPNRPGTRSPGSQHFRLCLLKMKRLPIFVIPLVCLLDLSSCTTSSVAPPVTAEVARTGTKQHIDGTTLGQGRTLFVSRCIECHTLPVV